MHRFNAETVNAMSFTRQQSKKRNIFYHKTFPLNQPLLPLSGHTMKGFCMHG